MDINKKNNLLKNIDCLTKQNTVLAFSGGVDSSLLLNLLDTYSQKNNTKVYAVTVETKLHPQADMEIAKKIVMNTNAVFHSITLDELACPEIKNNPVNRCYLCKKQLYKMLIEYGESVNSKTIIDGTNEDDLHVYRPGKLAIKELGIITPLAKCHITKKEVRELAYQYKVPVYNRPSAPCMATRLPYGDYLDSNLLKAIENAEEQIKALGFKDLRVRVHGDIIRVELLKNDFVPFIEKKDKIISILKDLNKPYITMDLEGFRSGSMDININKLC